MATNRPSLQRKQDFETGQLVKNAFDLARSLSISKLVVQADELRDIRLVERLRQDERLIWVVQERKKIPGADPSKDVVLPIPAAALSRTSQLNLALFLAALNRHVRLDETVLGLSGVAGSERLDTLVIANPGRDFPWFERLSGQGRQGREVLAVASQQSTCLL